MYAKINTINERSICIINIFAEALDKANEYFLELIYQTKIKYILYDSNEAIPRPSKPPILYPMIAVNIVRIFAANSFITKTLKSPFAKNKKDIAHETALKYIANDDQRK